MNMYVCMYMCGENIYSNEANGHSVLTHTHVMLVYVQTMNKTDEYDAETCRALS